MTATASRIDAFLTGFDLGRDRFVQLLDAAVELRAAKRSRTEVRQLTGRNIALIFQKNSTRTRAAFEIAAHDQGAHVTYLGPDGSHMGREESIADTAAVLGRLYDAIEFRGFDQAVLTEFAQHAGVPVWNGLTDQWHPTQMLADMLTMRDHHTGPLEDISYCFVGDGRSNMGRSLLVTGALLGMDVRVAAPKQLWPGDDALRVAADLARQSGAHITVTDELQTALDGAAFVHTDVWVSMGESDDEWATRVPLLRPYRVTPEVLAATHRNDIRFMHCLPAIHDTTTAVGQRAHKEFGLSGVEVTDEVFRSPASLVFEQAENRMHTIKALIVASLG